ncbi:MAG: hypothetical protein JKY37_03605 [Nannocystaceae bacterium]|nr:hypothetical protein [Nannocystaceae bacterium]
MTHPPQPPPDPDAGKVLLITGGALAGVGIVGGALLIGGLASANKAITRFEIEPDERAAARDDVKRGNRIGIVGGAIGATFTVTGAVLIGLGLRKRGVRLAPTADATSAGMMWFGRF